MSFRARFIGPRRRLAEVLLPERVAYVAIDPGVEGCGLALFNEAGDLLAAGLAPLGGLEDPVANAVEGVALAADWRSHSAATIVERPVIDSRTRRKADIITLALVAGGAAAVAGRLVRAYEPRSWKGSTDADAFVEIVKTRWVSAEERAERVVAPSPSLEHNVWDAVGLGVYHLRGRGLRA